MKNFDIIREEKDWVETVKAVEKKAATKKNK